MDDAPIAAAAVAGGACLLLGIGTAAFVCIVTPSALSRIAVGVLSITAAASGTVFALQARRLAVTVEALTTKPTELVADIDSVTGCSAALEADGKFEEIKTAVNDYEALDLGLQLSISAIMTG